MLITVTTYNGFHWVSIHEPGRLRAYVSTSSCVDRNFFISNDWNFLMIKDMHVNLKISLRGFFCLFFVVVVDVVALKTCHSNL